MCTTNQIHKGPTWRLCGDIAYSFMEFLLISLNAVANFLFCIFSKGEGMRFESMIFLIMDEAVALNQIRLLSFVMCTINSWTCICYWVGTLEDLILQRFVFSVVFLMWKGYLKILCRSLILKFYTFFGLQKFISSDSDIKKNQSSHL